MTNPSISERNYLTPINFAVKFDDTIKPVEYLCQTVNLPGVSVNPTMQSTPKRNIPFAGDKIEYDQFSMRFLVDEKMDNYSELLNWLVATINSDTGVPKDFILIIYNSNNLPEINIQFKNAFPVSLDPIEFDTTMQEVTNVQCGATFSYTSFSVISS